jgi:hypothetical protein
MVMMDGYGMDGNSFIFNDEEGDVVVSGLLLFKSI